MQQKIKGQLLCWKFVTIFNLNHDLLSCALHSFGFGSTKMFVGIEGRFL